MRKSKRKKMTLHRETLRNLQPRHLETAVAGARTENTCDISGCIECLPPTEDSCPC
jgi:hypothetical protein